MDDLNVKQRCMIFKTEPFPFKRGGFQGDPLIRNGEEAWLPIGWKGLHNSSICR